MPTHRQDLDRLSLSQLARLTGRAPATIRERLEGLEPIAADGRTRWYSPPAALERIFGGDGLELTAERARLAKEQADAQAMKNAEDRGELIRGADVETFGVALLSALVQRLRAVPAKAAPELHASGSIAQAQATCGGYIEEALADVVRALEGGVRRGVARVTAQRRRKAPPEPEAAQ